MNFIAATVELKSFVDDTVSAYGLEYRGADAVVPAGNSSGEVQIPSCSATTVKVQSLTAFQDWKQGTRALITGNIVFSDDTSQAS